jgi:hypothetical protein
MSKDAKPGFTVRATRGGGFVFKSKGRFDLCAVPALQELGLPKPTPLEKGEKCRCGAELPWHLFELAGERERSLTHRCSCGLNWHGEKEDGNFVVRMVQ